MDLQNKKIKGKVERKHNIETHGYLSKVELVEEIEKIGRRTREEKYPKI